MSEKIDIDGLTFDLALSDKRKTIGVKVHHDSRLTIQAPNHLSREDISIAFSKNKMGSQEATNNLSQRRYSRLFPLDGDEVPYMGQFTQLFVLIGTKSDCFKEEYIFQSRQVNRNQKSSLNGTNREQRPFYQRNITQY